MLHRSWARGEHHALTAHGDKRAWQQSVTKDRDFPSVIAAIEGIADLGRYPFQADYRVVATLDATVLISDMAAIA